MNTDWIDIATRRGATINITWAGFYSAKITWPPSEKGITVKCKTLEGTIQGLNSALLEDAADEMIKKGVV